MEKKTPPYRVGIDLGGTKIEGILIESKTGKHLKRLRIPTEQEKGYTNILHNIKKVVDHIRNEPPRGVVVSAVGGTTDLILEIIASAKNGNDVSKNLESLFQQFLDIARELELEKSSYLSFIEPIHLEAQNNLVEIKENIRFFSKSKDSILSIGERLTAFIVTQACLKQNINVTMVHGSKDKSVPVIFSKKVLKIFQSKKKKLVIIKNGDHSLSSPKWLRILKKELKLMIS
jgi:aspartokinase